MSKQRDPKRDAAELDALRDLGTSLFELRQAIFMMEAVDRQVMTFVQDPSLQRPGFAVFALTDEEEGARTYCLHHVGDLARRLLDRFDEIQSSAGRVV